MSKATIVFVHGLGGDLATTWGKFEELIKSDPELKDYKTLSIGYPTTLLSWKFWKKYPRIQTLADALRTEISLRTPDTGAKDIILVCHSLGGLIGRRYLLDEVKRQNVLRVRGLLLYSVPNSGAGIAKAASFLSWRHLQLRQLSKDSDLINDLDSDWQIFKMASQVDARYVVAGVDQVVDEQSARSFWGNTKVEVLSQRGHRDVVKPADRDDLSYLILKKFAISLTTPDSTQLIQRYATPLIANNPPKPVLRKGYCVIAFDFDGTLLRGCDFSWTVVWQHLGFEEAVYKGAMRDYLKGNLTYQGWCDLAVAQFRGKGLRRSDFSKIVSGLKVTNNLDSTLKTLRAAGFVLAMISGGIDTFIAEKIPQAEDLFDYICINRLRFDPTSGLISSVEATPFDFEGKAVALEAICRRHGCTMKEAVFVGEGFNDATVVNKAGLSIAYPPGETAIDAASRAIPEDDLSKILAHVL